MFAQVLFILTLGTLSATFSPSSVPSDFNVMYRLSGGLPLPALEDGSVCNETHDLEISLHSVALTAYCSHASGSLANKVLYKKSRPMDFLTLLSVLEKVVVEAVESPVQMLPIEERVTDDEIVFLSVTSNNKTKVNRFFKENSVLGISIKSLVLFLDQISDQLFESN